MKNKGFMLIISGLCLVFLILSGDKPKATTSGFLLNDIIQEVKGDIQECGVKTNFITYEDSKNQIYNILEKLKVDKSNYTDIRENEKIYGVEFSSGNIKGYIQSTRYEKYTVITIDIIKETDSYDLDNIEREISNAIDNKGTSYFKYIKAKINEDNLKYINHKIKTFLKREDAENISSIKIDNGYSTIAYSKKFSPITVGGKLIDLNYALCSYYSGNYIIIGTPEILTSY